MYVQGVDNIFDIVWNTHNNTKTTYADIHLSSEKQFSKYNFEVASVDMLFQHFDDAVAECENCLKHNLALPAYDQCMIASHIFNTLDARKAISVTNRQSYILKIRRLSTSCATLYTNNDKI